MLRALPAHENRPLTRESSRYSRSSYVADGWHSRSPEGEKAGEPRMVSMGTERARHTSKGIQINASMWVLGLLLTLASMAG